MAEPKSFRSGTVNIGSKKPLQLAGYATRKTAASSHTTKLEANWVLFGTEKPTNIIVAIDALFSSDALESAIRHALGKYTIHVSECMIVASHTHYAPNLDPTKRLLGIADSDHILDIGQRIALDIQKHYVSKTTQSVTEWHWGEAINSQSIYRRAKRLRVSVKDWPVLRMSIQIAPNPSVSIDQSMRIWVARTSEAIPAFAIVTWPCHTTSRSNISLSSSDFVGPLRQAMRRILGTYLPVIYLPGASGDVRPNLTQTRTLKKLLYPYPFQKTFAPPTSQAETELDSNLQATVVKILNSPMTILPFTESTLRSLKISLSDLMRSEDARDVPLYKATIGGLKILGVGAEVNSGWVSQLGYDSNVAGQILTGCAGQVFGYLPTNKQIPEGGYEVDGFRKAFEVSGFYQPGDDIAHVLRRALLGLENKQ